MLVSGVQHILCRSTVGNLWLNCLCCPCVVVIINLHFHCTFMDLFIIDYTQISETVIEDRFCLEHGTKGWYDALDHHFRWLLQYRISPFFCRWGDSMRILAYTCPWPGNTSIFVGKTICCYGVWFFSHLFIIIIADHPKAKEYYSDPRLAAYAVPYAPILSRYCSNFCQVLYQFAIYVFGSFFLFTTALMLRKIPCEERLKSWNQRLIGRNLTSICGMRCVIAQLHVSTTQNASFSLVVVFFMMPYQFVGSIMACLANSYMQLDLHYSYE